MTPIQQLAEWKRIATMSDCVTDERLCQEDIQAMVRRIEIAEGTLHRIADASPRGSYKTVTDRLCTVIDMARDAVS